MSNEIRIVIDDETKDGSTLDLGEQSKELGITSKTSTKNSKKDTIKSIGLNVADTASGGMVSKAQGAAGSMATPMAVATVALTMATKAYNRYLEIQSRQREQEQAALRAGGHYRSDNVNMRGGRVQMITGKIVGSEQTITRRR